MINKYVVSLLILVLFTVTFKETLAFPSSDSLVTRDTLEKSNKFQPVDAEKEIKFIETELAPQNIRIIFNEFFTHYLSIKDALAYNDPAGAQRNTLKLLDQMKERSKEIDKDSIDARWSLFAQNFDNIRSQVESLNFISEQRFMFSQISYGLQNFIKQYGLYDKTIYLMECKGSSTSGSGAWLSDSRDNNNPYLGSINDTTCSKVKEVWVF